MKELLAEIGFGRAARTISKTLCTAGAIFFANVAFSQELVSARVVNEKVSVNEPVELVVELKAIESNQQSVCSLLVDFGDGQSELLRVGAPNLTVMVKHAYVRTGPSTITISGKTRFQGLRSTMACSGSAKSVAISVGLGETGPGSAAVPPPENAETKTVEADRKVLVPAIAPEPQRPRTPPESPAQSPRTGEAGQGEVASPRRAPLILGRPSLSSGNREAGAGTVAQNSLRTRPAEGPANLQPAPSGSSDPRMGLAVVLAQKCDFRNSNGGVAYVAPMNFDFGDEEGTRKLVDRLWSDIRAPDCKTINAVLLPHNFRTLKQCADFRGQFFQLLHSVSSDINCFRGSDLPFAFRSVGKDMMGQFRDTYHNSVADRRVVVAQNEARQAEKLAAERKVASDTSAMLAAAMRSVSKTGIERGLVEAAFGLEVRSCIGNHRECKEFNVQAIRPQPTSRSDVANGVTHRYEILFGWLARSGPNPWYDAVACDIWQRGANGAWELNNRGLVSGGRVTCMGTR